jgi:hypothetical protein
LRIFEKNFHRVSTVNSQNLSYKLELNRFATLDLEESIVQLGSSPTVDEPVPPGLNVKEADSVKMFNDFPDSVDWGAKLRASHSKSSYGCPNSAAFASTSMLESAYAIKNNLFPTRFSVQQLIDCDKDSGCYPCKESCGGIFYTFDYLIRKGITTEDQYPRKEGGGYNKKCLKTNQLQHYKASRSVNLRGYSDTYMMDALQSGPATVMLKHGQNLILYRSGVLDECNNSQITTYGLIIGYSISESWWKVRMAYGRDWGEGGDIRIMKDNGAERESGVCSILEVPRRLEVE